MTLFTHGSMLLVGAGLFAAGMAFEPPPQQQAEGPGAPRPRLDLPVMGNADSNGSMIAVTGIDLTGSSILDLVDTQNRQLAVYQAMGGSESTQAIKLVGARRIDLDLQLYGLNDKSEYSYEDLQRKFAGSQGATPPVK
jgi:hypothetical protein